MKPIIRTNIVSEPYDRSGTPGKACTECNSAWREGEPEAHAEGCKEKEEKHENHNP